MTTTIPEPNLLTTLQVARYLGVSVETIYTWRVSGYGPRAVKVGKHLRWRPSEIEKWLSCDDSS